MNFIIWAIIGCEISFWLFLLTGFTFRYIFKLKTLSNLILILTPIIDLVLIFLTYYSLAKGYKPTFTHGLSAFYIGYSIMYGKRTIQWTDSWMSYYFKKGSRPEKIKLKGKAELKYQWEEFKRISVCSSIILLILTSGIFISSFEQSFWLIYWIIVVIFTLIIWFLMGPIRSKIKFKN